MGMLSATGWAGEYPAVKRTDWAGERGRGVQRTMRLLESSGPDFHPTVRILFYGQSITAQDWWKTVAADLRVRYPHADLQIENRAIGGFSSPLLKLTAHADLYPHYPDLLIFHVYGSHPDDEEIIRTVRGTTTAEVVVQTDHVTNVEEMEEPTDPTTLAMNQWRP
jgi:hypothetical protein